MKRLLAFLALATGLNAAHIAFDLSLLQTGPISRRAVNMAPAAIQTNGNSIATMDSYRFFTSTAGQYTVSNVVAGDYVCTVFGPNTNTVFNISVPDSSDLIQANTILAATLNTAGDASGYTQAAARSLFVLKTNGWSIGQILSNAVFRGSTNVFQHTNGAAADYVLGTDGTNAFWKASGAGESSTASNLSPTNATTIGVLLGLSGTVIQLRTLRAGSNMVLTNEGTNIVLASTASGGGGAGSLPMNLNQFATNDTVSIVSGVPLTNAFLRSTINAPWVAGSGTVINPTNGFRQYWLVGADTNLTFAGHADNLPVEIELVQTNGGAHTVTLSGILERDTTNGVARLPYVNTNETVRTTLKVWKDVGGVTNGVVLTWASPVLELLANGAGSQGDLLYNDGTGWVRLSAGSASQVLKSTGTTIEWDDTVDFLSQAWVPVDDQSVNPTNGLRQFAIVATQTNFVYVGHSNNIRMELLIIQDSDGAHDVEIEGTLDFATTNNVNRLIGVNTNANSQTLVSLWKSHTGATNGLAVNNSSHNLEIIAGLPNLDSFARTNAASTNFIWAGEDIGTPASGDMLAILDVSTATRKSVTASQLVAAGGAGTVTHTAGALTVDLPVLGNGGDDIKSSSVANFLTVLSVPTHAQLVTASNTLHSALVANDTTTSNGLIARIDNLDGSTNAINTRLGNLEGVTPTNFFSMSQSNATSKPVIRLPSPTSTNGVASKTAQFWGLQAGANVTLTPNASNIVIAASGSGGGGPGSLDFNLDQFDTNDVVSILDGALFTNIVHYGDITIQPESAAVGSLTLYDLDADFSYELTVPDALTAGIRHYVPLQAAEGFPFYTLSDATNITESIVTGVDTTEFGLLNGRTGALVDTNSSQTLGNKSLYGPIILSHMDVVATGMRISGNNGTMTWQGLGDGQDENLLWDANSTANQWDVYSGTSVDTVNFISIGLEESGNAVPNATDHLGFFAATTSAQLAGVLSDEIGSGAAVFFQTVTNHTGLRTNEVWALADVGTPDSADRVLLNDVSTATLKYALVSSIVGAGANGPGMLDFNLNQFDTNAVVSIKAGVTLTNAASYAPTLDGPLITGIATQSTTGIYFEADDGRWTWTAIGNGVGDNPESLLLDLNFDANTVQLRSQSGVTELDFDFDVTQNGNFILDATDTIASLAASTSAQLAGNLSDETGSGKAVFAVAPELWSATVSNTVTATQIKFPIWTNYVNTASNFVFSFNTNRYELKNQTNVVFTNLVEEATATGADMSVHIHNTTGVAMGIVWPAYGAQHGYYFQTNANNAILSMTSLASGSHGVASFTAFGTNIFATFTTWP